MTTNRDSFLDFHEQPGDERTYLALVGLIMAEYNATAQSHERLRFEVQRTEVLPVTSCSVQRERLFFTKSAVCLEFLLEGGTVAEVTVKVVGSMDGKTVMVLREFKKNELRELASKLGREDLIAA